MRGRSRPVVAGATAALAIAMTVGGAAPAEAADRILTREHSVTAWTTDDGLPENAVVSVSRTADGYLWVGTSNCGVARFNGIDFRQVAPEGLSLSGPPRVHRLMLDDEGTLWVSFLTGAIGAVRDGRLVIDRQPAYGEAGWLLHEPLGTTGGRLWFSTALGDVVSRDAAEGEGRWALITDPGPDEQGLLKTVVMAEGGAILGTTGDGEVWRLVENAPRLLASTAYAESGAVNCLARDRQGRVWAGTDRGLAAWDGAGFVPVATDPGGEAAAPQRAIAIMPVSDGGLWVLFEGALRKYRDGSWTTTATGWSDRLEAAVSPRRRMVHADDRAGGVWISTDGEGLWHVTADGRLVEATADPDFPRWRIACMETDAEGNLWLGLDLRGLVRVRPRPFQAVIGDDGLPIATLAVCEDAAGTIWLTGPGGILSKIVAGAVQPVAGPVSAESFTSLVAPARAGGIWLAVQFAELYRQEDEQRRVILPMSACRDVARALHEDEAGRLWVGNEYGFWKWQDGHVAVVGPEAGFEPVLVGPTGQAVTPAVEALADDGAGGLWIGLSQGELRHRDAEGRFTRHRPAGLQDDIRFSTLLPDGRGGVWIGTFNRGLVHFRDGVFRRVTEADGLVDDTVCQLLDDGRGYLWLGTFGGIVRIAHADLEAFFAGRSSRLQCRRFGRAAGLPVAQCAWGQQSCCVKARDGRLWFLTTGGLVVVDPASISEEQLPQPVVIEQVRVGGRDVLGERPLPLRLSPQERTASFEFASLSLAVPESARYRWRMAGLDSGWIEGGNSRTATYNQLPPGSYTFEVSSANEDGRWSDTSGRLPIVVEPFYWETAWFRGLSTLGAVMASAGIALAVIRRRTRRRLDLLERQGAVERERIRIARDLHDDLGASLTEIDLLGALAERSGPTSPEVADRLRSLRDKARDTVMSLDQIVWAVNPRNDTLGAVADYLGSFAQQFFNATGTRCRLDIEPEPRDLPVESEVRHALFLAFKEAVNNVARHARAEECRISLAARAGELTIRVGDDGCGFDQTAAGFVPGEGLRNIRERLAAVGGWQRIESAPGRGTTIVLGHPLDRRSGPQPFASSAGHGTMPRAT